MVWAIRMRLEMADRVRELAHFNLVIDSKLRGCDMVKLRVQDVMHGGKVVPRASIVQQKTGRPVQFELTAQTRAAVTAWIAEAVGSPRAGRRHSLTTDLVDTTGTMVSEGQT